MSEPTEPGGNGFDALAALVSASVSDPVDATAALRERLLASKARAGRYGIFVDRIARLFDLSLAEAATLLDRVETPEAWAPFLVPGTEMIPVVAGPKRTGAIATMVRIQPGASFPEHAHRGIETMLVVDGGFVELGTTNETWRGEELTRGEGTEHALVGLPGIPCVAAALITGYADFK